MSVFSCLNQSDSFKFIRILTNISQRVEAETKTTSFMEFISLTLDHLKYNSTFLATYFTIRIQDPLMTIWSVLIRSPDNN